VSGRRLHLPPERIGATRAELTDRARHYLRDVLRLAPGDPVELFDGHGGSWEATVVPGFVELCLTGPRQEAGSHGLAVHLLFALAKGERCELVVQKATELGAERVVPFAAARSVVRLDAARGAERVARWRRIAEEAARQCGRADIPTVAEAAPLASALGAVPPGFQLLVLHREGGVPLGTLDLAGAPGVAAVVGPEGGLTDEELAACEAAGALRGRLGPRMLRAETAAIAVVAVLQALAGDL
jgi:16S rRNA (uracil1498-N3)-methyltransferase